jgi:hypothetical protein
MAKLEVWQRGPVDGVPAMLQPVAHILLQVRESVGEMVESLSEAEWNARPAGVASAAFHVRSDARVCRRQSLAASCMARSTRCGMSGSSR